MYQQLTSDFIKKYSRSFEEVIILSNKNNRLVILCSKERRPYIVNGMLHYDINREKKIEIGVPKYVARKSRNSYNVREIKLKNDEVFKLHSNDSKSVFFEVACFSKIPVFHAQEISTYNTEIFNANFDKQRYEFIYPSLVFNGMSEISKNVLDLNSKFLKNGCTNIVEIYSTFASSLLADDPSTEYVDRDGRIQKKGKKQEFGVVTYHDMVMFGY